uniref:Uncharacterized protein n=1 Tax=Noccaea caerulescens TaxID=107243 RepID=A0A1J3FEW5_NOCCA
MKGLRSGRKEATESQAMGRSRKKEVTGSLAMAVAMTMKRKGAMAARNMVTMTRMRMRRRSRIVTSTRDVVMKTTTKTMRKCALLCLASNILLNKKAKPCVSFDIGLWSCVCLFDFSL